METDKLMHDLVVEHLRGKLSSQYREIRRNENGDPDLILANHGLVLAVLQVETERSVSPEKAEKWKEMALSGNKLILMVPKVAKVKTTELLWKHGLAGRVSVGSYEIVISMP